MYPSLGRVCMAPSGRSSSTSGRRATERRDVFADRVSSMCAGQESKREVRDRRSVGWDWRVAAVPGAEWRVPLWNTAGFEPRPAARLRLESHYLSLSLSLLTTSLSLIPSTRPRLLSSPSPPSGTSLQPCHSLPSLRFCSYTWSSLSLSLCLCS